MCQISEISNGSAEATGVMIVFSPNSMIFVFVLYNTQILKTSFKLSTKSCKI